jgi:syntaxin 1A
MARDRLPELKKKSGQEEGGEEMESLNKIRKKKKAKKDVEMETRDTLEAFLDRIGVVSQEIDQIIAKNTDEIRKLQGKVLSAVHRDEADEAHMEDLNEENKKTAKKVRNALRLDQDRLDVDRKRERKLTDTERSEMKMKQTQLNAQSKHFLNVWQAYNDDQVTHREKSKNLMVKQLRVMGTKMSDDDIENMLDEGRTDVFAQSILIDTQMAKQQLTELKGRHDEFIKLEASVREVRDMFMEIAELVQGQGEMIDNIALQVGRAEVDVEKGRGELNSAKQHRKKARRMKVCLCSTFTVVIVIVLIVLLSEFGAFG